MPRYAPRDCRLRRPKIQSFQRVFRGIRLTEATARLMPTIDFPTPLRGEIAHADCNPLAKDTEINVHQPG